MVYSCSTNPWTDQLMLHLTLKVAHSFLLTPVPTFCQPGCYTTVFTLCPIILRAWHTLRASCTGFQGISPNWQQKWLCAVYYLCVRAAMELGGTAVGRSRREKIYHWKPAWLSVQSVSLVTVAFRKPCLDEKNKSSTAPKCPQNWEQDIIYEIGQHIRGTCWG